MPEDNGSIFESKYGGREEREEGKKERKKINAEGTEKERRGHEDGWERQARRTKVRDLDGFVFGVADRF
jgi:hypothetical protein